MLSKLLAPKTFIPLLIIAGLLIVNFKARADFADPAQVKTMVKEGALLVDVRTPQEYSHGHIEGAINIPVSEVSQRLKEFGDPQKTIVVYCRSGARSARAKAMLNKNGFKAVHNLGGIGRWPK